MKKINLTLILVLLIPTTSLSQSEYFSLSKYQIEQVKKSYQEGLDGLKRKEVEKKDLENNFNKKYPLYTSLRDVRQELELELEKIKKMHWKKKGEAEAAFEYLAECMLETLKGEKVRLERFRIQVVYATSPYECYRLNTNSQNYFEYEFNESRKGKKVNPLTVLVGELSKISFNSEEQSILKKAVQDYKTIKLEEKSLNRDRDEFKQIELKYNLIAEFETHIENTTKCKGEHILQEKRLYEIQSTNDSEISSMEDLLYSTSKCRNAKIEKELVGNNFCDRFNFFIDNMKCINEYPDFAEASFACNSRLEILEKTNLKNILCGIGTKETPSICNDNGLDPYWKYRYICAKGSPHIDIKVTSFDQGRMGARELIGENIARGIPTVINMNNAHSSIIGVKSEGPECRYLIRNYKDQTEKWVDEDHILSYSNEFLYLK